MVLVITYVAWNNLNFLLYHDMICIEYHDMQVLNV